MNESDDLAAELRAVRGVLGRVANELARELDRRPAPDKAMWRRIVCDALADLRAAERGLCAFDAMGFKPSSELPVR